MTNRHIPKISLLLGVCALALVMLVFVGSGPAYSEDRAEVTAAQPDPAGAEPAAEPALPEREGDQAPERVTRELDDDGYEWSGSRPAADRYLWSHRPS